MAQAEHELRSVVEQGRVGAAHGAAHESESGEGEPAGTPDDIQLQEIMRRRELLGDEPPKFNIADNDDAHGDHGAHTVDRHGPQLPLPRLPPGVETKTVEGRIYGDWGWGKAESKSYKWTDHTTMNREVNQYIQEQWQMIRDDLAIDGFHESLFDAGHRVGQGYYNKGMYGAGPRHAEYGETSLVRVRIAVVEGSDPPGPFVVTAYPAGLG